MSEWQSIETAPRPGAPGRAEYLLGFVPDSDAVDLSSCITVIWWEPRMGPRGRGCWVNDLTCTFGQRHEPIRPTHWMHLPAPPVAP